MKIRVDRDVLAEAVAWAARRLPNRPSVPILRGLLIKANAAGVTFSSFDYDTSARITVPAQVTDEGEALVSGQLLADIARSLPNKPVDLSSDAGHAELVCGSARFTLQLLPVEDYPNLPELPNPSGTVPSADFARAVNQVVVAAGRDELLPVFTGVRLEIAGDTLTLLATDRYRMAMRELGWNPVHAQAEGAALVPSRVLAETARSMVSGETVTLALSNSPTDQLIGFEGDGPGGARQLTTRLLDGEFPKVRHLMDIKPNVVVRANTADLVDSVKRVALVAERNTPMRMIIGDEQISLEAASGDQAQASEALPASVQNLIGGEPAITAAGFNPHYLQDALGALDTPYVHFSFTQAGKPCLVQGLSELDGEPETEYRHVIMLMRLPN